MQDFTLGIETSAPREARAFRVDGVVLHRRDRAPIDAIALIDDAFDGSSSVTTVDMLDRGILLLIEEDDHEAWEAIRSRTDGNLLTIEDLTVIGRWLVSEAVRRPTVRPLPSAPGPAPTTEPTASTDGSPSTAVPEQPAEQPPSPGYHPPSTPAAG